MSRMERYDSGTTVKSRTKKNENLYNDMSGNINIDYLDIDVNNAIELNSTEMNKVSRENYKKQKEFDHIVNNKKEKEYVDEKDEEEQREKIHDINEILKLARQDKLFESEDKKRLINTEYNILTKLDIENIEGENIKKEDLKSLIDDIYAQENPKKQKAYSRKEEDDLFNDLLAKDSNDTIGQSIKLNEELSNEILDKSENNEKNDTKEEQIATKIDTSTLETTFGDALDEEKEGKGLTIAIVIVTLIIMIIIGFFVVDYFFGIDIKNIINVIRDKF